MFEISVNLFDISLECGETLVCRVNHPHKKAYGYEMDELIKGSKITKM